MIQAIITFPNGAILNQEVIGIDDTNVTVKGAGSQRVGYERAIFDRNATTAINIQCRYLGRGGG